jgi:hypothetical protein
MGSAQSGTPETSHASGPMRPFPRNRVGRQVGAIALPPTFPPPTGAAPAPPTVIAKRFIFFHSVRHPAEMAEPEITASLTHWAVPRTRAADS